MVQKACFAPLLAATVLFSALGSVEAQGPTVGLFLNDEASFDGYTFFAPNSSLNTYLINNEGKLVHSWAAGFRPGLVAYLLDSGNLLRTGQYQPAGVPRFQVGGQGGRVQEYGWDGDLLWDFVYSNSLVRQHHDIERLPNGNVLLIAWEYKSYAEAVAAGRNPGMLSQGELWPDHVVEIEPTGASTGTVVWEWHVWDHLIQDYDAGKDNYVDPGNGIADYPERVDLNYTSAAGPGATGADWLHVNAVDYNETFDQIILSVHNFSEIWVIDHSTTTAEAAGHTGGNSGKGGDLLYRWGNPQAYDRGAASDRRLYAQHDSHWIESGLPGAGNILVFNNGGGRPGGNYSSVDEIVPPVDEFGDYALDPGAAYGPDDAVWSYFADPPSAFYATNISGAQRLPNGDTLICDGPAGTFFEVTSDKETVWKYVNPIRGSGPIDQGSPPIQNAVFRVYRYGPDYPAFAGKDLTPGDPLEGFTAPIPAPDGSGPTDPMTCSRLTAAGDRIRVTWDAATCQADDYHLIYGNLADVSSHALQGAECAIGVLGRYDWSTVPAGNLFFLIVGVDETGVYESSWGTDSSGAERHGTAPSSLCDVTTKVDSETCP